jgi:hypothetical protein
MMPCWITWLAFRATVVIHDTRPLGYGRGQRVMTYRARTILIGCPFAIGFWLFAVLVKIDVEGSFRMSAAGIAALFLLGLMLWAIISLMASVVFEERK